MILNRAAGLARLLRRCRLTVWYLCVASLIVLTAWLYLLYSLRGSTYCTHCVAPLIVLTAWPRCVASLRGLFAWSQSWPHCVVSIVASIVGSLCGLNRELTAWSQSWPHCVVSIVASLCSNTAWLHCVVSLRHHCLVAPRGITAWPRRGDHCVAA
jgi:hypothetical protein